MSVQGQPSQQQYMLQDPSQMMQGQPDQQQQMVMDPSQQQQQVDPALQQQYDYYQQFQPPQQGQPQQQQPKPIGDTPYFTSEQLAEGYKNLQRMDAQRQQQLNDLQQKYDQVVNHALTLQKQQTQVQQPLVQNQEPLPWELPIDKFTETFNANPTAVLAKLKTVVEGSVEQKAKSLVEPLQQQLQATQMIINRQAVSNTFDELGKQYGNIPNYDKILDTAVNLITTDPVWVNAANHNPANALKTAFQAELGKSLSDQNFLANLGKNAAQQHQIQLQQRQYAQPMTTSSNVQSYPHAPMINQGNPPVNQNAAIAHQIATYNNREYFNPNGPRYQVVMNDYDF